MIEEQSKWLSRFRRSCREDDLVKACNRVLTLILK